MKFKKLSGALMASLMIHTAAVLLIGAYWVTKTPQPDDTITVAFLSEQAPPKQKMRKPAMAGRVSAIGTQPSPHGERRPPLAMRAVSNYQPTSVLEFSSKVARIEASDAHPSQISRHMVVPSSSNHSPKEHSGIYKSSREDTLISRCGYSRLSNSSPTQTAKRRRLSRYVFQERRRQSLP